MATTLQHGKVAEEGDGSRAIAVCTTQPVAGAPALLRILVDVAAAGIDDDTAGVFLRCWAEERGSSDAAAAAVLAGESVRFAGVADADLLSTVNRWIEALAPAPTTPRKVRRFLLGHSLLHE